MKASINVFITNKNWPLIIVMILFDQNLGCLKVTGLPYSSNPKVLF